MSFSYYYFLFFKHSFGLLSRLFQGKGWKAFSHFRRLREQRNTFASNGLSEPAIRYFLTSWVVKTHMAIWKFVIRHTLTEHFSLKVIHITSWSLAHLMRYSPYKVWVAQVVLYNGDSYMFWLRCVHDIWIADGTHHISMQSPLTFKQLSSCCTRADIPHRGNWNCYSLRRYRLEFMDHSVWRPVSSG